MFRGALSAILLSSCLAGAAAAQTPPAPPVTVAPATRQDIPIFASGIGTVQAYLSVLVRARVDGTLDKILFHEGQDVKPGEVLAEIDPRPYAATLCHPGAQQLRQPSAARYAAGPGQ